MNPGISSGIGWKPKRSDDDLSAGDILTVNGFQHFGTPAHGRLGKGLTRAQLKQHLALLKFLLVLFKRLVDVLAVF